MVPDLIGPVVCAARETLYLAVGTGVLAFQRAQVHRRELEQRFRPVPAAPAAKAEPGGR